MARGYGQYCPLALATELLGQRWTILVLSRVLEGHGSFNAIHRGIPRISPGMLAKRLEELESAGLLVREDGPRYGATPAGQALGPVLWQLGTWGQEWARDMEDDDLDPAFLAWSMHTRLDVERMPAGRTVLEFVFPDAPGGLDRFWLVHEDAEVDMCLKHPGFESDLVVRSGLRRFIEAWRGIRDLREEIRAGHVRVEGPAKLRRQLPGWLLGHVLAGVDRQRDGRERGARARSA